jgi:hypothetical protein
MSDGGETVVEHDRGLGTAYERWCFYQLLDKWASDYEVESFLEGPVDGMAGVRGVHGVGLARTGRRVVAAVADERSAEIARAVYAKCAPASAVEVRVGGAARIDELPPSDLVLAYHAVSFVADWRTHLRALAKLAKKLLVVTVCNPDNWGVVAIRMRGMKPPACWRTDVLAPELWQLGRVREHVYFDAPWWPDLQVAPGQALKDRLGQLFGQRRDALRFTAETQGAKLAERFVSGPDKWPYFGGSGWIDELEPALLRHPAFEGVGGRLAKYSAHLHGFVVDMRPRTPQGRRKLGRVDPPTARPVSPEATGSGRGA